MKRIFMLLSMLGLFCVSTFAQLSEEVIVPILANELEVNTKAKDDLGRNFKTVRTVQIDINQFYEYFQREGSKGKFRLMLPNGPVTVSWVQNDLIGENYQLYTLGIGGSLQPEPSELRTYNGYILDAPEHEVAITISRDYINMMIEQDNGIYYLDPLSRFTSQGRDGQFAFYRNLDFIDDGKARTCGTSHDEDKVRGQIDQKAGQAGERAAGSCIKIEVYIASDESMLSRYGTAQKVQAHTLAVWNNVTTNYKKVFSNDYQFKVNKQIVATKFADLPVGGGLDASGVLDNFRKWAVQSTGFGNQNFDIAQMWTTRDISGGVIGIAFVGVVCREYRAQLIEDFSPNSDYLRVVVAHETGHNFNINHDAQGTPYIMAPTAQITSQWSSQSRTQLDAYVNDVLTKGPNCFSACSLPNVKPDVDYTASTLATCAGAKIIFKDNSTNDPTSWLWSFPGGVPAQSNAESPQVVYSQPGVYDVTLKVTNAAGSSTLTKTKWLFVSPSTVTNHCRPDGTINSKAGIKSFKLGNMSNQSGNAQKDGNRYVDFSCNRIATLLPNTQYEGEFEVGDCASNIYESIRLFGDFNDDGDFEDVGEFIGSPPSLFCGTFNFQWTTPTNPVENKLLRLRVISSTDKVLNINPCDAPANGQVEDYGIIFQCNTPCGTAGNLPVANFVSSNGSLCEGGAITFKDRSVYNPSKWEWAFPGGTPATSTLESPNVTYAKAGIYDVTLKVTNTKGETTLEKKKFVTVDKSTNNYCKTPATLNSKAGVKFFKLANIAHTSGSAQVDANRYIDFSCTQIATLQPNTAYEMEIELGDVATNLKESFRIYIDYNNDNDFADAGEQIAGNATELNNGLLQYAVGTGAKSTLKFTTPAAPLTFTPLRLRVITQSSAVTGADATNPCYNPTDGQVEDYGVIFRPALVYTSDTKSPTCGGYDDGNIKITATGGKPPYSYDWSDNTFDGKNEATNLKAGTYAITVSDSDGSLFTRTFKLTEPDLIIINDAAVRASCSEPNGTISVNSYGGAGAPFSYRWSHNPDEKGADIANLWGGLYTVTATDKAGCKATKRIQVDSTIQPNVSMVLDTAVCAGQSVTLTASKGTAYNWSTGATTPSITVTTAGKYAVTATNGECIAVTSANVGFITFTPKISGDKKACQGNEIFMSATGGIDYRWSTGDSTALAKAYPQKTTTYTVTATFLGCIKTLDWTVTVTEANVKIASTKDAVCAGQSVTLSTSDGKPYEWSTGQIAASITVTPTISTKYHFVVGDIDCAYFVAKEIKVGNPIATPTVFVLGATTFCQGGEVSLIAPPDLDYKWSNNATSQTLIVQQSGTYALTVTKDGCSATIATPINVTVNPLPTASISATGASTICDGESAIIKANNGMSGYFWNTNETTQEITIKQAGSYTVTVTDGNGCVAVSTPYNMTTSPKPTVNAGTDVAICSGANTQLIATATGASAPYAYSWTPNVALTNSTINNPTASPTATTTYTLNVIDAKGCKSSDVVVVSVKPLPANPTFLVNKNLLTSNAVSGNQWLLNGQPIAGATNQSYAMTKDGIYSVRVTNAEGCSVTSATQTLKFIGIADLLNENAFKVFPNPTEEFLTVQLNTVAAKNLEVSDVLGRVILATALMNSERIEMRLETSQWNNGTYFIHVKNEDGEVIGIRKIVKM